MGYQERESAQGPKKMLAIDGGGLRGVLSLQILREIESMLRRETKRGDLVLGDVFDYVAGTSTGAIIAACIALGRTVDEIESLYRALGPKLFKKRPLLKRFWSLYDGQAVGEELAREFGEATTFGESSLHCLLLCVLQNATTDSPWPLSNCTLAKYNLRTRPDCNLDLPLWQVVRASTAAPVFFPPEEVLLGQRPFVFQDGGVTSYNNPAFIQFVMATKAAYKLCWPTGVDNLLSVSVGTGTMPKTNPNRDAEDFDLLHNLPNTISFLMNSASIEQDRLCRLFGRCRFGATIDREVGDLVAAPDSTDGLFTYVRYNADISQAGLEGMGLGQLESKQVAKLDAVEGIDDLATIGVEAAKEVDAAHFAGFLG